MASEVIRRVAALYDVHGNRPALDAALAAALAYSNAARYYHP
jgi:hypothetical protein